MKKNLLTLFKASSVVIVFMLSQMTYALTDNQVNTLVSQLKKEDKVMSLYSESQLTSILKAANYKQPVLDAFKRTAESLTWGQYRKIFI